MIDKSEALVLRITPFSRTSHVVTWLSPGCGRLVTLVKGACRPKSMFLGQYDLYYTCEVVFYRKERDGLHILKECATLDGRPAFRTHWRASVCASYLCDLLNQVSLDEHHQHELYKLATRSLDFLAITADAPDRFLFWFEVHLTNILGIAPQLSRCASCGGSVPAGESAFFSTERGGLICANCAEGCQAHPYPLGHDVLAILRNWQSTDDPRVSQVTRCSEGQLGHLRHLLGLFLKYHLDRVPESRYTALTILTMK